MLLGRDGLYCYWRHDCVCVTVAGFAVLFSAFALAEGMLHSATLLHTSILKSGLRAPMSFFDSTPIGRIMNRFSKDIDVIDTQLPRSLHSWVVCALSVMATIAVICYSTPMFLVVILPMSIIYFLVQVELATFQPIFIFTIFPRRTQLVSSIFFSFFLEFPD